MNKKQKVYLAISILTVVSAQFLNAFYRPYIYKNKIVDFGFADTIGSLASVIGFCFFVWSVKAFSDKEKNKQILLATFVYTLFWEPLGFIGIYGTFDWKDIIAGIVSGLLTFGIKELIEKIIDIEEVESKSI